MPSVAQIVDIRDPNLPLPGYLVLDANILLRLHRGQDQALTNFIARVQQAYKQGTTVPLVGLPAMEECYFFLIRWGFQRDKKLANRRSAIAHRKGMAQADVKWHDLYKDTPSAIRRYMPDVHQFHQFISALPVHIVQSDDLGVRQGRPSTIEEQLRVFVDSAYLLPKDAWIVAEAERLGVYDIATMDRDFLRLDSSFTIYTIP